MVRDLASVDYVMGERRCVMSSGNPEPYAVRTLLCITASLCTSQSALGTFVVCSLLISLMAALCMGVCV